MRNPKIRMTDFRAAALSGVRSWDDFARQFRMSVPTAEYTCKVHGIKPHFITETRAYEVAK